MDTRRARAGERRRNHDRVGRADRGGQRFDARGCADRGGQRFDERGCADRGGQRFDERGQAAVEVVALVPVVVVVGLALLQLLAVGYAAVLAGNAAEAGALALAAGADARAAVREALPGWSRARGRVTVEGGRVAVRLRPPSPLDSIGERLAVTGKAAVEAP
jgi:hypothetical protein